MLYETYTLLIIDKDVKIKDLFISKKFQVKYFEDIEKAKSYYQDNDLNVDLIINMKDLLIQRRFDDDKIATIKVNYTNDSLLNQVIDVLNNKVKKIEFNKELALSMLDNNENIYLKSLKRYYDEYQNIEEIMVGFLKENNLGKIREFAHKVKGFSLYLGSDKLYQISKGLEQKIVSNEATNEDVQLFINFNKRMLEYCKE